jgi:hypothetical protein
VRDDLEIISLTISYQEPTSDTHNYESGPTEINPLEIDNMHTEDQELVMYNTQLSDNQSEIDDRVTGVDEDLLSDNLAESFKCHSNSLKPIYLPQEEVKIYI